MNQSLFMSSKNIIQFFKKVTQDWKVINCKHLIGSIEIILKGN